MILLMTISNNEKNDSLEPFERLKPANDSADIALCRALILQAIVDASNTSHIAALNKLLKMQSIGFLLLTKTLVRHVPVLV